MLGKMTNKYAGLKQESDFEEIIDPENIKLNYEVLMVFKDKELYPKSFKQSDREEVKKSHPEAQMVSEGRITHPLFEDPIVVKKYKKVMPFEDVLETLKKLEGKAKAEISEMVQDYANSHEKRKKTRKYGSGRIKKRKQK